MKGMKFLTIVLALLITLTAAGCAPGISQGEYDKVVSDLSAAQSQIQALQRDYDKVKSDLAEAEAEVQALEERMLRANTAAEIVNALFVPVIKGEEGEIDPISFLFEWRDRVEATGDAAMKEKFQAVLDSQGGQEELMDFFLYLFESIPKTLE